MVNNCKNNGAVVLEDDQVVQFPIPGCTVEVLTEEQFSEYLESADSVLELFDAGVAKFIKVESKRCDQGTKLHSSCMLVSCVNGQLLRFQQTTRK